MALPPPVVPLDEVALIDAAAVALGQDLGRLMERAGEVVAREAERLTPEGAILVACGPGNNGGDGYVAARLLAERGREVTVWPVASPVSALCQRAASALPPSVRRLEEAPAKPFPLLIDAILGAGTRGLPRGAVARALQHLRSLGCPMILAADVPSGIGSALCLVPTRIISLQVAKAEVLADPLLADRFQVADIGIDPRAIQEVQPTCFSRFPLLKRDGHKGAHGELLVIGGGRFPGALEFACRAALMTGCDLVRAWTAGTSSLPPTIVVHRQDGAILTPATPGDLTPLLVRASAVLIGPGLGRAPLTDEAANQALSLALELGVPVILDADGITATTDTIRALKPGDGRVILTPHGGEARTLLGGPPSDAALHAFARPHRVVLAKGRLDLISDGQRWQRNIRGNPRMAVGGTGDVLAGLAAGLVARGASSFDAARMAVLWATTAGDHLWAERGPCYDALDLLGRLPSSLRSSLEPLGMWPPAS